MFSESLILDVVMVTILLRFYLFLEREGKGGKKKGEKHRSVVSHIGPQPGMNSQLRHVP